MIEMFVDNAKILDYAVRSQGKLVLEISQVGDRMWLNVNGVAVLRAQGVKMTKKGLDILGHDFTAEYDVLAPAEVAP